MNKSKSFDKSFKGDFNLNDKRLLSRDKSNQMIYTGAQIIDRNIFNNREIKPFSMNTIWDELIAKNSLIGLESYQRFLHVNTNETYQKLIKEQFIY